MILPITQHDVLSVPPTETPPHDPTPYLAAHYGVARPDLWLAVNPGMTIEDWRDHVHARHDQFMLAWRTAARWQFQTFQEFRESHYGNLPYIWGQPGVSENGYVHFIAEQVKWREMRWSRNSQSLADGLGALIADIEGRADE